MMKRRFMMKQREQQHQENNKNLLVGITITLLYFSIHIRHCFCYAHGITNTVTSTHKPFLKLRGDTEQEQHRQLQDYVEEQHEQKRRSRTTTQCFTPPISNNNDGENDFDALNQLYENAIFSLYETTFSVVQPTGPITLNMDVSNIQCKNLYIDDITVDSNRINDQTILVQITVFGLDVDCQMDYVYTYGFLPGSGFAEFTSRNNRATTVITFTSKDFNNYPPITNSTATQTNTTDDTTTDDELPQQECDASIQIESVNLDNDIIGEILERFPFFLHPLLEVALEDAVCDEFASLGTSLIDRLIDLINNSLDPYYDDGSLGESALVDPLEAEKSMNIPDDVQALNLWNLLLQDDDDDDDDDGDDGDTENDDENKNDDYDVENVIRVIFDALSDYLSSTVGPEGDLGINEAIRSILSNNNGEDDDNDGSFTVSSEDSSMIDPVLYSGQDQLMSISVLLSQIKIYGLDSFIEFVPFEVIGNYTLQSEMTWSKLTFQLHLILDIAPSTADDAFPSFANPEDIKSICEEIIVNFSLSDVNFIATLLMVIDMDELQGLRIGNLVTTTSNILSCLLSTIFYHLELTNLDVTVGTEEVLLPTLDGFQSPGLDRLFSQTADVAFSMYEGVLRQAIPNIFQTTILQLVNENLFMIDNNDDEDGENSETTACKLIDYSNPSTNDNSDEEEKFIDFRELLLPSDLAIQYGASGATNYGDVLRQIINLLGDFLFGIVPDTGYSSINTLLVEPWTKEQSNISGTFVILPDGTDNTNAFSGNTQIDVGTLSLEVGLSIRDVQIDNLNTIGEPISILNPIVNEPYKLNHTATIGGEKSTKTRRRRRRQRRTTELNNNGNGNGRPVRVSGKIFSSIASNSEGAAIANDVEVTLELYHTNVILSTLLKVSESRLFNFPLQDIFNLNCWVATIPAPEVDRRGIRLNGVDRTAGIDDLIAAVQNVQLYVECLNCTSQWMFDLIDLLELPAAQEDATTSTNSLLNYFADLTTRDDGYIQVQIDRLLHDAARRCPHNPAYTGKNTTRISYDAIGLLASPSDDDSTSFLVLLATVTLGLIFALSILMLVTRYLVRKRHQRWLAGLPSDRIKQLLRQQEEEQAVESALNHRTTSMFQSEEIPGCVRWGMPLIILCNIGFFLSGHLSRGATVHVEGTIGDDEIFRIDDFFEFTMARSTVEMWNAGGRELAILILIFSGIWPYTKQLITLTVWFLPPSQMSISTRGSWLLWLDWLAKWSMMDIFVLVITLAAFRISIRSPDVQFLPNNLYDIEMLVVPLWGLYANMIAQLISQVSSHFIIYYHRKIVHTAKTYEQNANKRRKRSVRMSFNMKAASDYFVARWGGKEPSETETLYKHSFDRPHLGKETERLSVRKLVNPLLGIGVLCLVVMTILGCVLPSFSLEVLGLVGIAIELGQNFEPAVTDHSVFTAAQLLWNEASFLGTAGDYIGFGVLSIIFIVTVLIVPIVQAMTLLYQWFFPTTLRHRVKLAILIEILQAWQYAEVYLISVFVASWQLGTISQFMVNSYCNSLDETFAQLVFFGLLKEEDAQCFSVQSSITVGSYLLFVGAILLALCNTFVIKAVVQYFRDKDEIAAVLQDDVEKELQLLESSKSESLQREGGEESLFIRPAPVLFTDTFRWLLRPEDVTGGSEKDDGGGGRTDDLEYDKATTDASPSSVKDQQKRTQHGPIHHQSTSLETIDDGMEKNKTSSGVTTSENRPLPPPPLPPPPPPESSMKEQDEIEMSYTEVSGISKNNDSPLPPTPNQRADDEIKKISVKPDP